MHPRFHLKTRRMSSCTVVSGRFVEERVYMYGGSYISNTVTPLLSLARSHPKKPTGCIGGDFPRIHVKIP